MLERKIYRCYSGGKWCCAGVRAVFNQCQLSGTPVFFPIWCCTGGMICLRTCFLFISYFSEEPMRMGIFFKFHSILNRHPMITQMLFSGAIVATGDIIAQYLEEKQKWDKVRTFRFATLVGCCVVPFQNVWYRFLQQVKHSNWHIKIAKRLAYDQLLFSPSLNVVILTGLPLADGNSWKRSIEIMKEDWLDVYINSLKLWPAVQIMNFYFVPLNYRVLLIQFVGLVWSTYLSLKTTRKTVLNC